MSRRRQFRVWLERKIQQEVVVDARDADEAGERAAKLSFMECEDPEEVGEAEILDVWEEEA